MGEDLLDHVLIVNRLAIMLSIALNRKNLEMTVDLLYNASIVKRWDMDLEIVRIQKKRGRALIATKKVICPEIAPSLENLEFLSVIIVIKLDI